MLRWDKEKAKTRAEEPSQTDSARIANKSNSPQIPLEPSYPIEERLIPHAGGSSGDFNICKFSGISISGSCNTFNFAPLPATKSSRNKEKKSKRKHHGKEYKRRRKANHNLQRNGKRYSSDKKRAPPKRKHGQSVVADVSQSDSSPNKAGANSAGENPNRFSLTRREPDSVNIAGRQYAATRGQFSHAAVPIYVSDADSSSLEQESSSMEKESDSTGGENVRSGMIARVPWQKSSSDLYERPGTPPRRPSITSSFISDTESMDSRMCMPFPQDSVQTNEEVPHQAIKRSTSSRFELIRPGITQERLNLSSPSSASKDHTTRSCFDPVSGLGAPNVNIPQTKTNIFSPEDAERPIQKQLPSTDDIARIIRSGSSLASSYPNFGGEYQLIPQTQGLEGTRINIPIQKQSASDVENLRIPRAFQPPHEEWTSTNILPNLLITGTKHVSQPPETMQQERHGPDDVLVPLAEENLSPDLTPPLEEQNIGASSEIQKSRQPKKCPMCEKQYSSTGCFDQHLMTHTGGMWQCICGAHLSSKRRLHRHAETHKHGRGYKCLICKHILTTRSGFIRHWKVHKGDLPFPCPDCPKRFVSKSERERHLFVHTGARPCICTQCQRGFQTNSNLRKHMSTHTRKHVCSKCSAIYDSREELREHRKTHPREFWCRSCKTPVESKAILVLHEKSHEELHLQEEILIKKKNERAIAKAERNTKRDN